MLEREQTDYLLTGAYNAAIRAGAKILEIYGSCDDIVVNIKNNSLPITVADREAHSLIKNYLGKTRIPLMSEEGRHLAYEERCNWDLYWLIDPLDGTKEFLKRNGEFTVNIALMVDNRPFFGVVYMPCYEKMYFNDPERGAFFKGGVKPDIEADFKLSEIFAGVEQLPMHLGENNPVRVVVSRSHMTPETTHFVELLRERHGTIDVIESGSSIKFCMVADGSADYYVRATTTCEWDTAAGDSIASSAGARAIHITDNEQTLQYNKESLENPHFVCCGRNVLK